MWWDTYKALWWQFWGWRWGEYNLDKLELFTDQSPSCEIKIKNPTVEYSPLQVLHLPGANLPPGGWDGLGEMEVRASWWFDNIAVKIFIFVNRKITFNGCQMKVELRIPCCLGGRALHSSRTERQCECEHRGRRRRAGQHQHQQQCGLLLLSL